MPDLSQNRERMLQGMEKGLMVQSLTRRIKKYQEKVKKAK